MKHRPGNDFLERLQEKRETAKRAAAAKAEREPEPADPEDARIRDLGAELQDFQEERRRVKEATRPEPAQEPGAGQGRRFLPKKRRPPWK